MHESVDSLHGEDSLHEENPLEHGSFVDGLQIPSVKLIGVLTVHNELGDLQDGVESLTHTAGVHIEDGIDPLHDTGLFLPVVSLEEHGLRGLEVVLDVGTGWSIGADFYDLLCLEEDPVLVVESSHLGLVGEGPEEVLEDGHVLV